MRALQVTELSGPTGLALRRVDAPAAGEDVVIDVHTAGVTFPDLLLTYGIYHVRPDLPFAPGLEVGGIVRSAPEGADVAAGDRVIAYTGHGGYAEAVSAPAHCVVPLPDSVDFVSGVSLMVNYQTAYLGVVERGHLRADETLLVHGAAGGVGTAAIQIGRSVGARVLAVVSDEAKAAVASRAGAEEIVFTGNWVEEVRERTAARMATAEAKELYKQRPRIAETTFGILKAVFGLRQFLLCGLEKVRIEWRWAATAFNLKKLVRHVGRLRAEFTELASAEEI